jgi:hypothetical protein
MAPITHHPWFFTEGLSLRILRAIFIFLRSWLTVRFQAFVFVIHIETRDKYTSSWALERFKSLIGSKGLGLGIKGV